MNNMEKLSQQSSLTFLRILYPIWIVFGFFSIIYIPTTLIVQGDAATTAKNIISNEFLFRAGIVGGLITQLIFIFAAIFLYRLLATVNKIYPLIMIVFALISVPIAMLNELNNLAAFQLLNDPQQMMFFLNLHAQGIVIASIFWGLWLFPLGILIYKSGYFPKIIGIVVVIGGIGYTLDSFMKLLLPNFAALMSTLQIMTFGEVIFLAWLVVKGAKLPKN
ncbi:MAG: DUF4386 domain-containing protein [Candidatus Blackburnbacteria bacterium]|nr:DUF4386 domain-containing protein [Candidatus Blackburnbacteria bacterium]